MKAGTAFVMRMELLHAACNWGAALVGTVYAAVAIIPHTPAGLAWRSYAWAAGSLLVSTLILVPLLERLLRSAREAMDRMEAGEVVPEELRLRAARAVLNSPLNFAGVGISVWWICAATIPLFFPPRDGLLHLTLHTVAAVALVGVVSFGINFYVLELYVQSRVAPGLLGETPATRVPGARPIPLGFRIALLIVTTSVVPVSVLTIAAFGEVTPGTTLMLGAAFLVVGALQGHFIARSVGRPLTVLGDAMRKVQQEELDAAVSVVSADRIGRLGDGFNTMVEGLRRGRYVKETFGRYVSPQVADEILRGNVALGGEDRFVTVLFSDIRGFTSMSEELAPSDVVRFLNQFLDRMVEVLVRNGATIDKFIGDAVMARFGVPVARSPEEDARAAVRAALEMQQALASWNEERVKAGHTPLQIGIGIHSGVVVAGNIGSSRKTEYTVIGDTVNTASRIESLTKQYDEPVLISEATRALLDETFDCEELAPAEVKGKRAPVRVFAVRGVTRDAMAARIRSA